MTYGEKKYTVIKAGTQQQGIVTEIAEGQVKDFVAEEYHEKWTNLEAEAIEITAEFEDGSKLKHLIALPDGESASMGSKMGQWIKAYGEQPAVEQEVYVTANAEGYFQFA